MSYSLFITFTYFISFNHDHKSVSLEGRSCLPHFIDEEMSFMEVQWLVHSFQDFSATLLTQYQALSMTLAAYEIDYYSFRPGTVSFFLFIPSAVPILFSVGGTQNFSWQDLSIFCTWIWLTCFYTWSTSKCFYMLFLNWQPQLSQEFIKRGLFGSTEPIGPETLWSQLRNPWISRPSVSLVAHNAGFCLRIANRMTVEISKAKYMARWYKYVGCTWIRGRDYRELRAHALLYICRLPCRKWIPEM